MSRLSSSLRRAWHRVTGDASSTRTLDTMADLPRHAHPPASPTSLTVVPAPASASWATAPATHAGRIATASDERRGGELAAMRRDNAPGLAGPRDDDYEGWLTRARQLHADDPYMLAHVEQVVRVATWIAEAGRVYQRLTDHDGRVLMAAAAVHHLGEASGLHVTSVPAVDGTLYLAQRGARRLASLLLYHAGNEQTLGRFDVALTATLRPDPLHDLLVLADLHVAPDGRVHPPMAELDRRLADPTTPGGMQQFLYTRYHDLFTAVTELERWAGRYP